MQGPFSFTANEMLRLCCTGRSCCRIDDQIYADVEAKAIPINGCTKNWYNRWAPTLFFIYFVICYLAGTIPNAVFGSYFMFGALFWLLVMGFLFLSLANYMPTEMKIDGSNAYIKMGSNTVRPYLKLTNVRFRKPTNIDIASCRWPRCWCDEHNRGLNWAEYETDRNKLTCIQGDLHEGSCSHYPAYIMIVPAIDGIEDVSNLMHA